jgi:hypothetical protein
VFRLAGYRLSKSGRRFYFLVYSDISLSLSESLRPKKRGHFIFRQLTAVMIILVKGMLLMSKMWASYTFSKEIKKIKLCTLKYIMVYV